MMAELVILSGEAIEEIAALFPFMTEKEKAYVLSAYPELMGNPVAAVVGGIAAVTTGIIGAVSSKRRADREQAATKALVDAQNKNVEKEILAQQAILDATKRRNTIVMYSSIGAGILALAFILKKTTNKKQRK
jgi:hypothetical protein